MSVRTASGGKAEWAAGVGGTNFVEIPELRTWSMSISKESKQYASSSTGGGKQRIGGAEDFNGSLSIYVDRTNADAAFDVDLGIKGGEYGVLKLYESASKFYTAPVYIEDADVGADIEGDALLEATVTFSRNGTLVYPTAVP